MRRLNQSFLAMYLPMFFIGGSANASVVEKAQEWLNNIQTVTIRFPTLTKNKIKFKAANKSSINLH